jgi:hypothetical protein
MAWMYLIPERMVVRWGKRNVVSFHFSELVLEIGMPIGTTWDFTREVK